MITQSELVIISTWTKPILHQKIMGKSFNHAMNFRRNLQIALTEYSKHNKVDSVQLGIISITGWLEKWCRDAYFKARMPELLRQRADLVLKPKKFAKNIIRSEWETMAARWGY
jgi:hypothetical protein